MAGGTFLGMGLAGDGVMPADPSPWGFSAFSSSVWACGSRTRGNGYRWPTFLQVSGSVLILMALIHSEKAWSDGTVGGWCAGILGLLLPVALLSEGRPGAWTSWPGSKRPSLSSSSLSSWIDLSA